MKAMILCAGLGTRLRPWTLTHPKALVPVGGIPMLRRVVDRLSADGFDKFVVNTHHFSDQIVRYITDELGEYDISVSDESDRLLDTGGGLLNARNLLDDGGGSFLVHNVDILSDADLRGLYSRHCESGADVTLLVSDRESTRRLIFDPRDMTLKGWLNTATKETRPKGAVVSEEDVSYAFSGIYVVSPMIFDAMLASGYRDSFPIMDFFLDPMHDVDIRGYFQKDLELIDIGKPETLRKANLEYGL